MMHRLRQRHAHEAGRRERAIEPRQLHHLDDGAHAGAFVADAPGVSAGEFDLARRIGAVAELVLEPLQPQRIDRAVGPKARHEKTGEPARRLRQHQKGVAHRRREKPFVAGDRNRNLRHGRGGGGIGAHVGAALLFGHAHAERHARFFPPRPETPGRNSWWRLSARLRPSSAGSAASGASAARVMVMGHRCPLSICAAM